MPLRRGFSLVELLAVIGVVLLLGIVAFTLCVPATDWGSQPLRDAANCTSDLRGIGTAIAMYTTSQDDKFPVHTTSGKTSEEDYTNVASVPMNRIWDKNNDGVMGDWALTENPMDNVWLLVAQGTVSAKLFQCPVVRRKTESADYPDTSQCGWTNLNQFSYGIHNPYSSNNSIAKVKGSFVIMADQNPANGWGRNHSDCVISLRADGCVYKKKANDQTAYMTGIDDDNIYEEYTGTDTTKAANDTYIVPKAAR